MAAFGSWSLAGAQQPEAGDVLVIALSSAVTSREPLIRVETVANFRGGPPQLQQKVAGLDLAEFRAGEMSLVITREQVSYRLQIAGIDRRLFRVEGGQVLVRSPPQEVSEESLVAAAQQAIQKRLPSTARHAVMKLAQPVRVPELEIGPGSPVRLAVELSKDLNPLGQVRVPVAIYVNGQRRLTVAVYLNVSYLQRTSAAEAEEENDPVLVRAHDMVKLVANIGAMRVTALGEALQEGRVGQNIRVRNVDSNKIVVGRISDRLTVDVDY